eukprot:TRINITY_DN8065_c0_g1_i1.p1 TRINITY_DN8065_c0_g1~~TRINITY_DN8065_c0_g1_i1.p1  ORF type:complete len:251 (+),score=49.10 TRINITY_DN8065_c0_g1_i1:51-803(+)
MDEGHKKERAEEIDDIKSLWDTLANAWNVWIGNEGDWTRKNSTDRFVWQYAGELKGKKVLDAGCGNGYLSIQLAQKGAEHVIGVDISPNMIAIAKEKILDKNAPIEFRVDSTTELVTIQDESIDLIISNFSLMDSPHPDLIIKSFHRVLKTGGKIILIFLHPCFSAPGGVIKEQNKRSYVWDRSYFQNFSFSCSWATHVFPTHFLEFHRPLSFYWKLFKAVGLKVLDFEEPGFPSSPFEIPLSVLFYLEK